MSTLKLHTPEPRPSDILTSLLTPSRDVFVYHVLRDIDEVLERAGIPASEERCALAAELADIVEKYRQVLVAEER